MSGIKRKKIAKCFEEKEVKLFILLETAWMFDASCTEGCVREIKGFGALQ